MGDTSEKPKTARSYRAGLIDDNFSIHINIKWLGQLFVAVAGIIYGYLQITNRIAELERGMELADTKITELVGKHIIEEEQKMAIMEEQLDWYQKELNLNPLSWAKKRKKK
jgi:hypothetical protein